jgi:hypothetical protein
MQASEIRKYPKCFAKMAQEKNLLLDSCSFSECVDFFESMGIIISIIPIPFKRNVEYAPIIIYCIDTNSTLFLYDGEWKEEDYTEKYEIWKLDFYPKKQAESLCLEKAFNLTEQFFGIFNS